MDGLLSYACGDAFRPQMELPAEVFTVLLEAQNRPPTPVVATYTQKRDRSLETTEWHNKPVTIEFNSKFFYQVNDGAWKEGLRLEVDREGLTKFVTKPSADAASELLGRPREIGIDLTPPRIVLRPRPELGQEGPVYYAVPDTVFALEAQDDLSGVRSIEVKIDGADYSPYAAPSRLNPGRHSLWCRVTDRAGNRQETMTGPQMAPTNRAVIVVRPQEESNHER